MEYLLWKPQEYQELYNCSFYKVDTIPLSKRQHPILGSTFLALFVIFELLYIPSIWTMTMKRLRKQACYKIMIYIGVIDASCLVVAGFCTGLFSILGIVYCSAPLLVQLMGELGLGCWIAQCDAGMILAFNRCLEMYDSSIACKLFNGQKVFLWLLIPTFHSLFVVIFTKPIFFSSVLMSWFFNPHIGYFDDPGLKYVNWFHTVNNIMVLVILTALYSTFVFFYLRKVRYAETTKTEKRTFLQVFIICSFTATAAAIFAYEQFFPVNEAFIIVGSYAFLLTHGCPSVIYLTLNNTIRRHVFGNVKIGHILGERQGSTLNQDGTERIPTTEA